MKKVSLDEARERLPELLDEVDRGEEVVIAKGDGATYRITFVALEAAKHVASSHDESKPLPSLAEMIGRGAGLYQSPEEVDQYIRNLRDEWDS